ncbi:MAG: PDZ domain-containing protein [Proteobacteria bacterium]|nr:MAG: PDZ domain-containing protein [Pseudomonadota bacterium]
MMCFIRRLRFVFMPLVLILASFVLSPRASAANLESSIIKIYSYIQRPDYDSPWTTKQSERLTHMGLIVGDGKVLVSAYAARSAKHLEAEKIGESKRFPLKLIRMDPVANLALFEFSEGKPEGLEDITFGEDLEIGANCTVYQAIEGESLVARALRLREVQMQAGVLTSYQMPQYVFEIRKPGYGWFEPMIRNGKLVGSAISQSGSNVFALPVSLIKRFVKESLSDNYRGFPELGISFSNLLSPALRKFGKADDYDDGVWIQDIKETSAFAKVLKKGDILYELNGIPVSARGSYEHPLWGRISITAKLSEIYAGDKVELKVLRQGRDEILTENIGPYNPDLERIPSVIDEPPKYMIFGGLVIQELTEGLMQSWGTNWRKRAPLAYLYEDAFYSWPVRGGETKVLVLQRVLPLDYNKGYHSMEDSFVTAVNGIPVTNLTEMSAALDRPEKGKEQFARFQLDPGHEEIILSYKGIDKIHGQLRQRYGIPKTAKFWETSKAPD